MHVLEPHLRRWTIAPWLISATAIALAWLWGLTFWGGPELAFRISSLLLSPVFVLGVGMLGMRVAGALLARRGWGAIAGAVALLFATLILCVLMFGSHFEGVICFDCQRSWVERIADLSAGIWSVSVGWREYQQAIGA